MELLKPLLIKDGVPTKGKVVMGTVQGDMHDIGKNLVGIMLKGAGYEVVDLGTDVPPQRFIDTAIAENSTLIGLSALLTTTMPVMKEVVDLLKAQDPERKIKIIIGGAPVSRGYADEIGADDYAFDGLNAVERIDRLFNGGEGN
ncbi:MAG: cobalamin-binding protein, partial [bacterium]|nr:cobalamin-binding protein [bacterium]